MKVEMEAVDMKNEKSDTEKDISDENRQELKDDLFKQVRNVSHLVANARFQAQEADIRARYAAEFAERAVTEAQLAHMVASTLARTGRVVASMALELANKLSLDVCGDGDFLNFLPDSMQSGDSSRISGNNSSFEDSFRSPATETNQARNPRRRSPPKSSPVPATAKKHDTIYPEDISPEESLADLLDESKSLPTVWEDSYSNGWESTPESWASKKHTLQMLRKLHSRKGSKQTSRDLDNDSDSDASSEENFPPIYLDGETQTTFIMDKQANRASAKMEVELKSDDNNESQRSKSTEIKETVNDKLESMLEQVVNGNDETNTVIKSGVAAEMYKISGFGLDE